MGTDIKEKTPSGHAGYEDLFDLRIEGIQHKEVEEILINACAEARESQWRRKVLLLELRDRSQDGQDRLNSEKVKSYREHFGLYLDGVGIIFSVGSACFGGKGSIPGGLMEVAAMAFSKTAEYSKNVQHADITIIDHRYQRKNNEIGEQSQDINTAGREIDQNAGKIDRLMQTSMQSFQALANSQ